MSKEETLSYEQLQEQIELDELSDAECLTPREYARLRGMSPQLVYYHLRVGTIESERCSCGRRVVRVSTTDESLQAKARERGVNMDSRSDEVRTEGS